MSPAIVTALQQLLAMPPGPGNGEAILRLTRVVCVGVFGQPLTLAEVGRTMALSKGRIRQIERQALRHLGEGLIVKLRPVVATRGRNSTSL